MILHTAMITYNRLYATKKALQTYRETVTVPFTLTIVDNGSTDGTVEWLRNEAIVDGDREGFILLGENKYPGYACNRGWEQAPDEATFLHRADNDFAYLPGWCEHVARIFRTRRVGQVGLRTDKEESHNGRPIQWNVGGNNVIRRALWDKGLRYDERPWPKMPAGCGEDTYLSPAVEALRYKWTRVRTQCLYGVSVESKEDPYYIKSYTDRRIYGFK